MQRLNKLAMFGAVRYAPHEGQLAVHDSTASRRVLACGVRWGKSTLCVHEALAAMLTPGPASRGWLVTPTVATTELLTGPLFRGLREHFAHRVVEIDDRDRRAVVRNLAGNLAEVVGKSADRPAALLGASLDWLIVDEAARLREEIWTSALSQRLVDRQGWALLASTPRGAGDWFHEQYARGLRREEGYASWTGPSEQNPALDPAVIEVERGRLTLRQFRTEYGGAFVGPNGIKCALCGWGEPYQKSILWMDEWRACRPCEACRHPIDADGKPVGNECADGSVYLQLLGTDDDEGKPGNEFWPD
jgi:hypothetical protein